MKSHYDSTSFSKTSTKVAKNRYDYLIPANSLVMTGVPKKVPIKLQNSLIKQARKNPNIKKMWMGLLYVINQDASNKPDYFLIVEMENENRADLQSLTQKAQNYLSRGEHLTVQLSSEDLSFDVMSKTDPFYK